MGLSHLKCHRFHRAACHLSNNLWIPPESISSISTLTINKRYQISYTNRETQSAQQIDRLSKRCFGFRTSKSLSKCNAPFGLKRTSPILASVGVNSKIYRSSPAIGTLVVLELAATVM